MDVQLLIWARASIFRRTLSYRMKSFSTDTLKSISSKSVGKDTYIRILFQHMTENYDELT